jgi:hypothetical protein
MENLAQGQPEIGEFLFYQALASRGENYGETIAADVFRMRSVPL